LTGVFQNWDDYLTTTTLYNEAKLKSVKKWQLVQSADSIGLTTKIMKCKSSNIPDGDNVEDFLDSLNQQGPTNEQCTSDQQAW
jgi:hypothetical protein